MSGYPWLKNCRPSLFIFGLKSEWLRGLFPLYCIETQLLPLIWTPTPQNTAILPSRRGGEGMGRVQDAEKAKPALQACFVPQWGRERTCSRWSLPYFGFSHDSCSEIEGGEEGPCLPPTPSMTGGSCPQAHGRGLHIVIRTTAPSDVTPPTRLPVRVCRDTQHSNST